MPYTYANITNILGYITIYIGFITNLLGGIYVGTSTWICEQ